MGCDVQLDWRKFGLSHAEPDIFGTSQWQDKGQISISYLAYRLAVFVFIFSTLWWDFLSYHGRHRTLYMIYLTNWTYVMIVLDTLIQLITAVITADRHRKGFKPVKTGFRWLCTLQWMVISISEALAPFVSIIFWTVVFPVLNTAVTYEYVHMHVLSTLYTFCDLMLHGSPARWHHFVYPVGFGLAYFFFTFLYYQCGGLNPYGGTGIYPILAWQFPAGTLGMGGGSVVLVSVIHMVNWGFVMLRENLHELWLSRKDEKEAGFETGDGGDDDGAGRNNEGGQHH